jgi:hypothetical protein
MNPPSAGARREVVEAMRAIASRGEAPAAVRVDGLFHQMEARLGAPNARPIPSRSRSLIPAGNIDYRPARRILCETPRWSCCPQNTIGTPAHAGGRDSQEAVLHPRDEAGIIPHACATRPRFSRWRRFRVFT